MTIWTKTYLTIKTLMDILLSLVSSTIFLSSSLSLPLSLSLSLFRSHTSAFHLCSVRACSKLLFFLGTLLALALLHFLVWQFLYFTPLSLFLSQSISPSPFGCLLAFVLVFTLIKKQHWLETFHGLLSSSSKKTLKEKKKLKSVFVKASHLVVLNFFWASDCYIFHNTCLRVRYLNWYYWAVQHKVTVYLYNTDTRLHESHKASTKALDTPYHFSSSPELKLIWTQWLKIDFCRLIWSPEVAPRDCSHSVKLKWYII